MHFVLLIHINPVCNLTLLDSCPFIDICINFVCNEHSSSIVFFPGQCAVYQALCLEHLSARELESLVATKLQLVPSQISRVVKLTSSGILVLMDDMVGL